MDAQSVSGTVEGWEMRDETLGVEVGGAVLRVGEEVTLLVEVGLAGLV